MGYNISIIKNKINLEARVLPFFASDDSSGLLSASLCCYEKRKRRQAQAEVYRNSIVWRLRCELYSHTAKMPELAVENVVVHPLVLLSVVDHFNRSVTLIFVFSFLERLKAKVSRTVMLLLS